MPWMEPILVNMNGNMKVCIAIESRTMIYVYIDVSR